MRVLTLEGSGRIYTSRVYLVLGDWSSLEDVNTLVDVGQDPAVLESIQAAPTGVGKTRVERVILTHGHYDHCALLPVIRKMFHPEVLAFTRTLLGVDRILRDGDKLRLGDSRFEVLHTPGHSSDSICLYNAADGVLFAGDTPLLISSPGGTYESSYVRALERLCQRDIRRIYFGHGNPLIGDSNRRLRQTLEIVRESRAAPPPLVSRLRPVRREGGQTAGSGENFLSARPPEN